MKHPDEQTAQCRCHAAASAGLAECGVVAAEGPATATTAPPAESAPSPSTSATVAFFTTPDAAVICLHDLLVLRERRAVGCAESGRAVRRVSRRLFLCGDGDAGNAAVRARRFCWAALRRLRYPGLPLVASALFGCWETCGTAQASADADAVAVAIVWVVGRLQGEQASRWDAAAAAAAPPPPPPPQEPTKRRGKTAAAAAAAAARSSPKQPQQQQPATPRVELSHAVTAVASASRGLRMRCAQLAALRTAHGRKTQRLRAALMPPAPPPPHKNRPAAAAAAAAEAVKLLVHIANGGEARQQAQRPAGATAACGREALAEAAVPCVRAWAVDGGGDRGKVADVAAAWRVLRSVVETLERPALRRSIKQAWSGYKGCLTTAQYRNLKPCLAARRAALDGVLATRSWSRVCLGLRALRTPAAAATHTPPPPQVLAAAAAAAAEEEEEESEAGRRRLAERVASALDAVPGELYTIG